MSSDKNLKKKKPKTITQKHYNKWIAVWLSSVVLILFAGSVQHFLYTWTNCDFVGLFAPINESVWEHNKLVLYPMLIWWIIVFFALKNEYNLNAENWFFAMTIALFTGTFLVIALYYMLFTAFGIKENIGFHLSINIFALIFAQLFGFLIQKYTKPKLWQLIFAIICTIGFVVSYSVLTFYPPQVPVFISKV